MNIKKLRNQRGWSQTDLAQKIQISNSYMSQMESGERKPSYEVLVKLADAFGVSIDELIGRSVILPAMEDGWYWVRRQNGSTLFPCQYYAKKKAFWDGEYRDDLVVLSEKINPPGDMV